MCTLRSLGLGLHLQTFLLPWLQFSQVRTTQLLIVMDSINRFLCPRDSGRRRGFRVHTAQLGKSYGASRGFKACERRLCGERSRFISYLTFIIPRTAFRISYLYVALYGSVVTITLCSNFMRASVHTTAVGKLHSSQKGKASSQVPYNHTGVLLPAIHIFSRHLSADVASQPGREKSPLGGGTRSTSRASVARTRNRGHAPHLLFRRGRIKRHMHTDPHAHRRAQATMEQT